jgi:general stress protein 26
MAAPRNEDELRIKVRELMQDIGICMFTTVDEAGRLRSRPMQIMGIDPDGVTAWFFTDAKSPKTAEVGEDGRVLMAFSAPSQQDYVSVYGQAEIRRDPDKANQLWSEGARPWFPDGPESAKLALIAVTIEGAQYWDSPSSTVLHAYGYAKALLTGAPPEGGEVGRVRFS